MKTLRCFVVISLSLILVSTTLTITYAAPKKPIELRWCTFFPPAHPLYPMSQKWGGEIEKLTGGQVKFTYFPGGTLLKGTLKMMLDKNRRMPRSASPFLRSTVTDILPFSERM